MTWQVLFLLLCLLPAYASWAEVYHCKTGRGTINYTNVPCIDKAPPKPIKREFIAGKTAQWVDPSQLGKQALVSVLEPIQTHDTLPVSVQAVVAKDSYTTAVALPLTKEEPLANTAATAFINTQYQTGMRWLLRTSGSYMTYEQYEITHVENQIITWTRTLLNGKKEPFAGGLSEAFTMDLRQQPSTSDEAIELRLAGYVFDTHKHQTEQAISWHVSLLPLITPLIRYRSGDETVLVEFNP
ncbi:MAG: DUF4124 domain-containing protein [Mariprofundaceae bacterium]|nr:DUF4124 domain-containing protein [Mariprofundaceae bacterium]